MEGMTTFLGMLGAFGGLAGLALVASKFLGGDIKIRELLSNLFKKKTSEQITRVDNDRKGIAEKIVESEKIADKKKEEVKIIAEKAKQDIINTLEKDDLAELVMESDDLWGK